MPNLGQSGTTERNRQQVQEAYERTRRAYRIECPTCGALPNFKCLTKNGYPTMHKARKDAANA